MRHWSCHGLNSFEVETQPCYLEIEDIEGKNCCLSAYKSMLKSKELWSHDFFTRGSAHANGLSFLDFCNAAAGCQRHVSHAQITLTFHYPEETIEMCNTREVSREFKILMGLGGKWLQACARGREPWRDLAVWWGEDTTCKAGQLGAWAHNKWSEVCVVSVASGRHHRSQSYFYRKDRSVAMLSEKVSCSLEKTELPLRGASHLKSGHREKEE